MLGYYYRYNCDSSSRPQEISFTSTIAAAPKKPVAPLPFFAFEMIPWQFYFSTSHALPAEHSSSKQTTQQEQFHANSGLTLIPTNCLKHLSTVTSILLPLPLHQHHHRYLLQSEFPLSRLSCSTTEGIPILLSLCSKEARRFLAIKSCEYFPFEA